MAAAREDRFANVAAVRTVMSAANVLTFSELLTGISLGQGVGMLIDQIDYHLSSASERELVGSADSMVCALTTSNDITDISDMQDRRILHSMVKTPVVVGSVVSLVISLRPVVFQFFPPLILAAPRIQFGVDSAGFGAAGTVDVRIYFRYITLSPQQYLELAEAFILTG